MSGPVDFSFQCLIFDAYRYFLHLRMESMHVFNCKGTLSEAEWRVAR
jgi:hypothetical protein